MPVCFSICILSHWQLREMDKLVNLWHMKVNGGNVSSNYLLLFCFFIQSLSTPIIFLEWRRTPCTWNLTYWLIKEESSSEIISTTRNPWNAFIQPFVFIISSIFIVLCNEKYPWTLLKLTLSHKDCNTSVLAFETVKWKIKNNQIMSHKQTKDKKWWESTLALITYPSAM